ncbi:hypothetical protein CUMW_142780, partial [Citrus unshiu]
CGSETTGPLPINREPKCLPFTTLVFTRSLVLLQNVTFCTPFMHTSMKEIKVELCVIKSLGLTSVIASPAIPSSGKQLSSVRQCQSL